MSLYTSSYLKGLSKAKSLNESTRFFSSTLKTRTSFDIFLSHSFLDKDEVEGLYLELSKIGYSVYVDWIIDPQLDRSNVTKESATLIRLRMKSCKSLLLATSINATVSKWIPWELGYVDGHTNKCAIIPVSPNDFAPESYEGTEYLSLYPFIKKHPTTQQREILWVIEAANKYVNFEDWLRREMKPEIHNRNIF